MLDLDNTKNWGHISITHKQDLKVLEPGPIFAPISRLGRLSDLTPIF